MDTDEIFIWIQLKSWAWLDCKFNRTLFSSSNWCICPNIFINMIIEEYWEKARIL